jgi:hypothetical protein
MEFVVKAALVDDVNALGDVLANAITDAKRRNRHL